MYFKMNGVYAEEVFKPTKTERELSVYRPPQKKVTLNPTLITEPDEPSGYMKKSNINVRLRKISEPLTHQLSFLSSQIVHIAPCLLVISSCVFINQSQGGMLQSSRAIPLSFKKEGTTFWSIPGILSCPGDNKRSGESQTSSSSTTITESASHNNATTGSRASTGVSGSGRGTDRDRDDDKDFHKRKATKSQCQASEHIPPLTEESEESEESEEATFAIKALTSLPPASPSRPAMIKCMDRHPFIEWDIHFHYLHQLFQPEVLKKLTHKDTAPQLEIESIDIDTTYELLGVYQHLLDREIESEKHDHTMEIPFNNLFKCTAPAAYGNTFCKKCPEHLTRISTTLQTKESAKIALLMLPYILSRAVAFLDFKQGVLSENSFVLLPDLSVSMLSTSNIVGHLKDLDDVLIAIPGSRVLRLFSFKEAIDDSSPNAHILRARALANLISLEGEQFVSKRDIYPTVERPVSQYPQRKLKKTDTISSLRVLPGQLGLIHSEHHSGSLGPDTAGELTLLAVLTAAIRYSHKPMQHEENVTHYPTLSKERRDPEAIPQPAPIADDGGAVSIGDDGWADEHTLILIERLNIACPEISHRINQLTHALFYEDSQFDEDLIRNLFVELEKRIEKNQMKLDDNVLRHLSEEMIKLKSSQRYKIIFDDKVRLHWNKINKELTKITELEGGDIKPAEELEDWGEINNNFKLVMKLPLTHKSFMKVLSILIKRLSEISATYPATVSQMSAQIYGKVKDKIHQYDMSEETLDTEFADAVFKAYQSLEKPGTQAMRYKVPPKEVLLKWAGSDMVKFWEQSNALNIYNPQDRSFMLKHPDCFLWLIKQDNIDYKNRRLFAIFSGMLREKGLHIPEELLKDYWDTLIAEYRRLCPSPAISGHTCNIYKKLPGPERVRAVQRMVGGQDALRNIRENTAELLFIEGQATSRENEPAASQDDKQLQLVEALRSPSFAGKLQATSDGSLGLRNEKRNISSCLLPPSKVVKGIQTGSVLPSDVLTLTDYFFKMKVSK